MYLSFVISKILKIKSFGHAQNCSQLISMYYCIFLRCGPLLEGGSLKHAAMSSLVLEAYQLHLTSCRIAGGGLGFRSASGPKRFFAHENRGPRAVDRRNPAIPQLRLVDDLIISKGGLKISQVVQYFFHQQDVIFREGLQPISQELRVYLQAFFWLPAKISTGSFSGYPFCSGYMPHP